MNHPTDDKKETVKQRAAGSDEEEGAEKTGMSRHKNIDTIKHREKKMEDMGVKRMDRHPVGGIGRSPPKSGHGGKYTWEGPYDLAENDVVAAIDDKDPNYVDEEEEGLVDVAKVVGEGGVGRLED